MQHAAAGVAHACAAPLVTHRPCPPLPPPLPAAAASLGDTATPLGKAVRILNNQLQALTQVRQQPLQVSLTVRLLAA